MPEPRRFLPALALLALATGPSFADVHTVASRDEIVKGMGIYCGGTFLQTRADDGQYQCLQESYLPTFDFFRLENKYVFQCVPAGAQSLTWDAIRVEVFDDNFDFLFCDCDRNIPDGCKRCDANNTYLVVEEGLIAEGGSGTVSLNGRVTSDEREFHVIVRDTPFQSPDTDSDAVGLDLLRIDTQTGIVDRAPAADHSLSPGQPVSGSFADLETSDNRRQVLRETLVNNKSRLKKVWRFDGVPAGFWHELIIEGQRVATPDGDNFRFGWNTTGGSRYQIISGAVIGSTAELTCGGAYLFASGSVSGTLYIMMEDTQSTGKDLTTVEIDRLIIRTHP